MIISFAHNQGYDDALFRTIVHQSVSKQRDVLSENTFSNIKIANVTGELIWEDSNEIICYNNKYDNNNQLTKDTSGNTAMLKNS